MVGIIGCDENRLHAVATQTVATGGKIVPCKGDLASEKEVRNAITKLTATGTPLRGWVNNAYHGRSCRLEELEQEEAEAIQNAVNCL